MSESTLRAAIRAAVVTAVLGSLFALPAAGTGIEIRGTLLCRPDGDPRRERPVDSPCLIVVPVGRPESAEFLDDAGFFRVRVSERDLDRMLVLRIHRGAETIDLIRTYLDSRRIRGASDRYVLGAHVIPGDCASLECSAEEALAFRDSLHTATAWQGPPPEALPPRFYRKPWSWVAATLPVALVASLTGGGDSPTMIPLPADSLLSTTVESLDVTDEASSSLEPGRWPALARQSSSPALGRSITSWLVPSELALWNPSALALGRRHGISVEGGVPRELRAAAWAHPRTPIAVSLGYAWRGADRGIDARLSDGSTYRRDLSHGEDLLVVGFGVAPRPGLSLGGALRRHSIRFERLELVERTTRTFVSPETSRRYETVETRPTIGEHRTSELGLDLGSTWDLSPAHRVAAVVQDVGDSGEAGREGILGYEHYAGRMRAGLEASLHDDRVEVAGGLSVYVADALSVDLAAGSRFETMQAGVDLRFERFAIRARVRSDAIDSMGATGALAVRL